MVFKVFLDANVCLDFLLQRNGFEPAEAVIDRILNKEIKAFITPTVLHIIVFYLGKVHSNEIVKAIILHLLTDIDIIDCSKETAISAVGSKFTDIEDALQYYTAIHHKMDFFLTNDKNLKKQELPVLPIYFPKEYLGL